MIRRRVIVQTNSTSELTFRTLNQIHAHLLKINFSENPSIVAPLLSYAATSNNPTLFSYACTIFEKRRYRSTFLYNNMIRGYVQSNLAVDAIFCYKKMLKDGLIKNNYTFTPLIKACSMVVHESRYMGFLVHGHVVRLGFCREQFIASALIEFYSLNLDMGKARVLFDEMPERDVVLWTTMIDGYGKMGDIENARELFEEMPEKNVISWSTIMAAYSRISDFREVLSLFKKMEEVNVKPNESVFVSTLTACAHTGALAQGLWLHSYANWCKLDSNAILATALVDMYSKCGSVELALSVFEGISDKGSRAWNAIISGVAMNGEALKSLQLFDEMVLSGIQPTDATFVSVLMQTW
ncbi:pentatricopeptide repeat-containing At5g66520-like [Olea europaea subsp. europaea]|uniref:Pentatricopeptide repeat-containing At5g66520-like n=1 Tax=Olea europaea subsp. europaea TaxID=158383 RepID=A0A8S0SWR9_OLEEU|nr:pentatricopeptide repeat-containing At5g66520-like [Olea europaea subsp. europaea]